MVLGALGETALAWAQGHLSAPIAEASPVGGGITGTKWLLRLADIEPTADSAESAGTVPAGSPDRLVVRWCDPLVWGQTGREHVRRESLACQLLAGSTLPVPRLIAADVEGALAGGPANLATWLPGAVRTDALGQGAIEAMADLAVSVHLQQVAGGQRPPLFSHRGPALPEVPGWTSRPTLWQRAIDLRAAGAPPTPFGLLHRDLHLGNILWQGDRVSGLIDWAEASWGPPDIDVAHLCSDFAMLHAVAGADAFRTAYTRRGGRLEPEEFRYWQVSDILGFLPDPAHILPAVAPARPDLTAGRIRDGLEELLALTLA